MKNAELIGPHQIEVGLRVSDKPQLLRELARRAAAATTADQPTILQALQVREGLGSTGLGNGFALPHARVDTLAEPFAYFARLARPIDFAAIDGRPVDLVVMLLTSEGAASQHLRILAGLSRPFRDKAFVRQLREAPDAAAVHVLLSGSM